MAKDRPVYMGPRLRRLRRELGLTQSDMAADLEISASYVALLERNQRPLTADMLLRLARTYRMDMSELAGDGGGGGAPRVEGAIALACAADHAHRLIYTQGLGASEPTPIGLTCRLCHRSQCMARSAPPIGREMLPEDYRRGYAPFGFADG